MLSARWAHRSLVGICILLAFGVLAYAGWQGWLGAHVHTWLRIFLDPLVQRLPNSEFLDRLARVLGATGTALTAAFGVYKGIYYADRNLPERLKQLLGRTDARLREDREPLLAATNRSGVGARSHKAIFYVGPLNEALSQLRFPNLAAADKELEKALRELKVQLDVADCQKRNIEEQKVAAHILRGSIASSRAEFKAGSGESPDEDRHAAEEEFAQAIVLRPADLDALELRGRQRELRGNHGGAQEDFEALTNAAQDVEAHLRAARGFRLQGELKEKRATTQGALIEARRRFGSGITTINGKGSLNQSELLEKGRLHLAYGRVQISLGRIRPAKGHLENSAGCFKQVKAQEALDLLIEAERMLKAIEPPPIQDGNTATQKAEARRSWFRRLFG